MYIFKSVIQNLAYIFTLNMGTKFFSPPRGAGTRTSSGPKYVRPRCFSYMISFYRICEHNGTIIAVSNYSCIHVGLYFRLLGDGKLIEK